MSALRSAPVGAILLGLLAALLLAVLGPAQDADSAAPRVAPALTVAPAATMPGESVLVEGRGWPVGTRVIFSLGGANTGASGRYGAAMADTRGQFQAAVALRALPNGKPIPTPSSVVLVAHSADYRLAASARVVVARPTLTAQPTSGAAGTAVTLSGQGWPAGTRVALSLGGANTGAGGHYAIATADARGRVTMRVRPSALPSGVPLTPGRITLLAHNADGSLKATAPFTVTR